MTRRHPMALASSVPRSVPQSTTSGGPNQEDRTGVRTAEVTGLTSSRAAFAGVRTRAGAATPCVVASRSRGPARSWVRRSRGRWHRGRANRQAGGAHGKSHGTVDGAALGWRTLAARQGGRRGRVDDQLARGGHRPAAHLGTGQERLDTGRSSGPLERPQQGPRRVDPRRSRRRRLPRQPGGRQRSRDPRTRPGGASRPRSKRGWPRAPVWTSPR